MERGAGRKNLHRSIRKSRWGLSPAVFSLVRAETGKLLLDKGMDFDGFQSWAEQNSQTIADSETFAELQSYWNKIHEHEQTGGMDMA